MATRNAHLPCPLCNGGKKQRYTFTNQTAVLGEFKVQVDAENRIGKVTDPTGIVMAVIDQCALCLLQGEIPAALAAAYMLLLDDTDPEAAAQEARKQWDASERTE